MPNPDYDRVGVVLLFSRLYIELDSCHNFDDLCPLLGAVMFTQSRQVMHFFATAYGG